MNDVAPDDGPCPECEDGCERCDPRFLSTDRVADDLAERLEALIEKPWDRETRVHDADKPLLRAAAEALDEAASLVDRKLELADKMVDVITTNVGQSHIDVYNTLIKLCKEYRNEPSK